MLLFEILVKFFIIKHNLMCENGSVGITADVGLSRALLSDQQCHFYGSFGSVPEAFYTGISTVFICITCFMQLQSIMYISLIVVVDLWNNHQAIQSNLCCAYITI
jgi:hypothetical protein